MANVSRINGIVPVRYKNGAPYAGAHNLYHKLASTNEAIFVGDPVRLSGTAGLAGVRVGGVDVEGMPGILEAAVSTASIGVVVGFYPNPDALGTKYSPASTAAIVMVADTIDLIFEVQEDSVSANFTAEDVGRHVDFIAMADGNTTTGVSAMALDSNVTSVTGAASFRLLRLVPRAGNVIGTFARWEVQWIEHTDLPKVSGDNMLGV